MTERYYLSILKDEPEVMTVMEAAKILAMVREQEAELKNIIKSQLHNSEQMENLYNLDVLNIQQIEAHREFGIKLTVDIQNQERKL